MERRKFIAGTSAALLATPAFALNFEKDEKEYKPLGSGAIQHMVIFDLTHPVGSQAAKQFLADGKTILSAIPVVKCFQAFRQTSKKNDYTYGFSMIFDNQADYQTYNDHPAHVAFVENRWKKEVSRFLEIDFEPAE